MIGGIIISIRKEKNRKHGEVFKVIVVNEKGNLDERVGVHIKVDEQSKQMKTNGFLWWQVNKALYTPLKYVNKEQKYLRQGVDYDIILQKLGYSFQVKD